LFACVTAGTHLRLSSVIACPAARTGRMPKLGHVSSLRVRAKRMHVSASLQSPCGLPARDECAPSSRASSKPLVSSPRVGVTLQRTFLITPTAEVALPGEVKRREQRN